MHQSCCSRQFKLDPRRCINRVVARLRRVRCASFRSRVRAEERCSCFFSCGVRDIAHGGKLTIGPCAAFTVFTLPHAVQRVAPCISCATVEDVPFVPSIQRLRLCSNFGRVLAQRPAHVFTIAQGGRVQHCLGHVHYPRVACSRGSHNEACRQLQPLCKHEQSKRVGRRDYADSP